jgi:hypothetical protein
MTGAAHHIAGASLPVALGLLVLALAARLALWAPADDARLRAAAREYLAPLSAWCLIAAGVYAVALGATGEASALSFAVAAAIAGVALALHAPNIKGSDPFIRAPGAAERPEPTPAATANLKGSDPFSERSLWAEGDAADSRTGLWSR